MGDICDNNGTKAILKVLLKYSFTYVESTEQYFSFFNYIEKTRSNGELHNEAQRCFFFPISKDSFRSLYPQ